MTLKQCQEDAKEYFIQAEKLLGRKTWPRFVILARLEEELSEIARIMSVEEGYRPASKIDNMDMSDEFGDALFQLVHLANQCNIDLENSWTQVMEKYAKYLKPKDLN